ncbi:hypothetical protein P153DRAFT_400232 [Dothidotthia symphoricarpi CBS 119687]|uniref:Uncharacterized protein n=1 Tax=Dothidotthia symphoricarpi CBS 119687 TaxID=1392245 RepID=A0A6A6A075_9PLEO|nr:uncharacterized protein P153DRAFT_400232 [Dothidotthia symphoricarpi CBS 119687]KAF2125412.1 hypothetical protein P153DRAFT_400232 [Dothidotthia symphoricarpi CBS 119687]
MADNHNDTQGDDVPPFEASDNGSWLAEDTETPVSSTVPCSDHPGLSDVQAPTCNDQGVVTSAEKGYNVTPESTSAPSTTSTAGCPLLSEPYTASNPFANWNANCIYGFEDPSTTIHHNSAPIKVLVPTRNNSKPRSPRRSASFEDTYRPLLPGQNIFEDAVVGGVSDRRLDNVLGGWVPWANRKTRLLQPLLPPFEESGMNERRQ